MVRDVSSPGVSRRVLRTVAGMGLGLAMLSCSRGDGRGGPAADRREPQELRLLFTYGSEKQKWLEDATQRFVASRPETASGRPIRVEAIPLGSGELVDELLEGRRQAHLASPASGVFVTLGNAESRARTGRDLLGRTESLVLSPVVIAMWKPMAEALGWGRTPIGWTEILAVARNPRGWTAFGHPEWGAFKLGHTHPRYSNSGLAAVLAEVYAATGKTAGLTLEDLQRPGVAESLGDIERAIVHYGSSTGFFGRKMCAEGPGFLSAAVLYENMVIESTNLTGLAFPLVAVYPREGTFWSDHPVGIVDRDWVTAEHREAAELYIRFLLDRPQQQRALSFGFRPADPAIPVGVPFYLAMGVNPNEPKTTLEVPPAAVVHAALTLWEQHKKHSDVVLALDVSGSMKEGGKWDAARAGAKAFLQLLGDQDHVSVVAFNDTVRWVTRDQPLRDVRDALLQQLDGMFADGGTALYDAIGGGLTHLRERRAQGRIQAVVVLSDGDDRDSRINLKALQAMLRADGESAGIRVFTIGYGKDSKESVLKDIAERTGARYSAGDPATIREVFKDISTFF